MCVGVGPAQSLTRTLQHRVWFKNRLVIEFELWLPYHTYDITRDRFQNPGHLPLYVHTIMSLVSYRAVCTAIKSACCHTLNLCVAPLPPIIHIYSHLSRGATPDLHIDHTAVGTLPLMVHLQRTQLCVICMISEMIRACHAHKTFFH